MAVSIVVPVYNGENYIRKCLDSIIGQSLSDIEVIVIDDGSIDQTKTIVEEYCAQYPGLVSYYHEINSGQGVARNYGITKCSGEYIGFVDSDDYVETSMYEEMYAIAKSEAADMVQCLYYYEDQYGKQLNTYGSIHSGDTKSMFINPLVSPWNKIFRRDIIIQNKVRFTEHHIYEDTAFYIKSLPYLKNISTINKALVHHVKWMCSTVNSYNPRKTNDFFYVMHDIIDFYQKKQIMSQYHDELEYFIVKSLLCSSLVRVSKITDRTIRDSALNETWKLLNENFPNYKKNKYLRNNLKGVYIKLMSKTTFHMIRFRLMKVSI